MMDVCQAGNIVGSGVMSMDHSLSLESELVDLTGFSLTDLRAQNDELLASSSGRLLRQVYRANDYASANDDPPLPQ
jgi:hypothetical protein